jgi:hypothetical protein
MNVHSKPNIMPSLQFNYSTWVIPLQFSPHFLRYLGVVRTTLKHHLYLLSANLDIAFKKPP